MPKGMLQALLGLAPNSQVWAPADQSNCIFRNTEAADSIDVLVRALKSLGTTEDPADPKSREKGYDATRSTGGKHIRILRDICQKETS